MLNNPINASDPTGHKCVGEPGECLKADGSTGAGFTGGPHSSGAHGGCGNPGQKRCDGKPPKYGDGLFGPAVPPTQIGPQPATNPLENDLTGLGYFIKGGKFLVEFGTFLGNYGTPFYRQAKGFGNAGPWLEGGASAILQAAQDLDDPSFTPLEKFARAGVVGFEDGITEVVSEVVATKTAIATAKAGAALGAEAGPGGVLAGGLIGAGAGYLAGNVGTNLAMNYGWSKLNAWALPNLFPQKN